MGKLNGLVANRGIVTALWFIPKKELKKLPAVKPAVLNQSMRINYLFINSLRVETSLLAYTRTM